MIKQTENFSKLKKDILSAETLRYIVCGFICGVIINLGVYYILANLVLSHSKISFFENNANSIGTATGWITATVLTFIANKVIVFRSEQWRAGTVLKEFFGTVGARGFSFIVTTFGMKLFVDMNIIGIVALEKNAHGDYLHAKGAVIAFIFRCLFGLFEIIFNYIMNKLFIFGKKDQNSGSESDYSVETAHRE